MKFIIPIEEEFPLVLPKRVRSISRVIFVVSLFLILIPLCLEHFLGLYLYLPEAVKTVLMLVLEVVTVVSLLLGFRLSEYRWLRVVTACLLGVLVALSLLLTLTSQRNVVTVADDSGPQTLVIQQSSWELGTDNRLFLQINSLLLRSLDKNLITGSSATPFSTGDYTLEWAEDSVTICYKEGTSDHSVWSTVEVPLQ